MLKFVQSQSYSVFVCNFSRELLAGRKKKIADKYMEILKSGSSAGNAPKVFFNRILTKKALVNNSYFFQNSSLTEIIRH